MFIKIIIQLIRHNYVILVTVVIMLYNNRYIVISTYTNI